MKNKVGREDVIWWILVSDVVIDVRLSLYLAAILDLILFPFPLTHAEKLVIDWSNSIGAANMTVLLITHH